MYLNARLLLNEIKQEELSHVGGIMLSYVREGSEKRFCSHCAQICLPHTWLGTENVAD